MGETRDSHETALGSVQPPPETPNHSTWQEVTVASPKPSTAPAFQFYPRDFLSSTKVQRMSLTEMGIYIKLLSLCWLDGSLPADTRTLARILNIKPTQLSRIWPNVLAECFTVKGDRLHNERLDAERKKQAEYRRRQSDNGKQGGRPRKPTVNGGLATSKPLESEAEAKKSSSSSSSSSTAVVQSAARSVTRPTSTLIPKRRMDAAFESPRLYVPNRTHQDFIANRNHPAAESELMDWYQSVCEEWTTGPRAKDSPGADMIRFWKARFDERWPAAPSETTDRRVPAWAR
jgi:uncharacterized protein YdaU (DUF1376 family)